VYNYIIGDNFTLTDFHNLCDVEKKIRFLIFLKLVD